MINDFLKKNLTNNALFDDYGLQYNNCPNIDIEIIQDENSFASLSNKVLIKCSGDDTKDFLNTQFTNDITKLQNHSSMLSGYCNPKGRLISIFYIYQIDKVYYLYTTLESYELLYNKLNMYKMMSKVEIEVLKGDLFGVRINKNKEKIFNDIQSYALKNYLILNYSENQLILYMPPDYDKKMNALFDIFSVNKLSYLGYKAWDYLEICNYIPFIRSEYIESFTPQMVSLDKLNGVSFEKGCYPGQEIVARTHYLGESKKSLFLASLNTSKKININDKIIKLNDNKNVGEIINFAEKSFDKENNKFQYYCLCVLRKDSINEKLALSEDKLIEITITDPLGI